MEKWLILGLEQEIDKMNLNHAVVTEKEELAQKKKKLHNDVYVKRILLFLTHKLPSTKAGTM